MKNILSKMGSMEYHTDINRLKNTLSRLRFETHIIATTPPHEVSDYKEVCHDTFQHISSTLDDGIKELMSNYAETESVITKLNAIIGVAENEYAEKWSKIIENNKEFIDQSFSDTSADRIYNYSGCMNIIEFITVICDTLNKETISLKSFDKLVEKSHAYSSEEVFDETAGKPMSALGFRNLSDVSDVVTEYGKLLSDHVRPNFIPSIKKIANYIGSISKEKRDLDNSLTNDIAAGNQIQNTDAYEALVKKVTYCKVITSLITGTTMMLSKLDLSVGNLINVATNCRAIVPPTNVTEDMGGCLIPEIIEEQPIGVEGFVQKTIDRFTTYLKDSGYIMETPEYCDGYMDFIHNHLTEEEVTKYTSKRKWLLPNIEDIIETKKSLEGILSKMAGWSEKYNKCTRHEDVWKYDIKKQLDIPELNEMFDVLTKIGSNITVGHIDRYTQQYIVDGGPKDVKDILKNDVYIVSGKLANFKVPPCLSYNEWMRWTRQRPQPGKLVGAGSIEDLDKLYEINKDVIDKYRETMYNEIPEPLNNKNFAGIKSETTRDSVIVNYWRSYVFRQFAYFICDIYVFCSYHPYILIRDVKKFA